MSTWTTRFREEVFDGVRATYLSGYSETAAINVFNTVTADLFDLPTRAWKEPVFSAGIAKKFGPATNPGETFWRMPESVSFFGRLIQRWRETQINAAAANYGTQRQDGGGFHANLPRDLRKVAR